MAPLQGQQQQHTSASSSSTALKDQQHPNRPLRPRSPKFPAHNAPRVWFLVCGTSPISISLARQVLEHGDYVCAGVLPSEFEKIDERSEEFKAFLEEAKRTERWRERLRVVGLDARVIGQCQAAIAEAVDAFGRVDVLLGGTSEAVIGAVEELAQSDRTHGITREQFDINFFANVNIIKAALPAMRKAKNGHIMMLTGVTGHLGTPGLGLYCASQWAIEGYCDSLAYEIAPFNIKVTIVQPNMEISVLTNRIVSVPPMAEYSPDINGAPLAREMFSSLFDKLDGRQIGNSGSSVNGTTIGGNSVSGADEKPSPAFFDNDSTSPSLTTASLRDDTPRSMDSPMSISDMLTSGDMLSSSAVTSIYAPLSHAVKTALIAETVHALTAVGGHDNPPARHIVGFEGVASVKEKLKTVSEELEDFLEVSSAVDLNKTDVSGTVD